MEENKVNIKYKLNATQDKKKIYADKGRTHKEFWVANHVFFKVKVKKSSLKLERFSKLTACYCGFLELLERIGPVAHILALCTSMCIHNFCHVYLLKKYVHDPNHVIDWIVIQVEHKYDLWVQPMCILDRKFKVI